MPRVLIISYVYPPMKAGGTVRLVYFSEHLAALGWDVSVVAGAVAGETPRDPEGHRVVRVLSASEKVAITRRGRGARATARHESLWVRWLKRAARLLVFPDRYVDWGMRAVNEGKRLHREAPFDVILASSPPPSSLMAGLRLSRDLRVPLVADFRDGWAAVEGASFATRWHRRSARRAERRVVEHASAVVGVAQGMCDALGRMHGLEPAKLHAITNGFDPRTIELAADARRPDDSKFRLVYTGSVHQHYDFSPVFGAIAQLRHEGVIGEHNFEFLVVGNMHSDEAMADNVRGLVRIEPMVPFPEVFRYLAMADALLLIELPGYYRTATYATKVFDYALTGKPVLALIDDDGNSARFLGALGVGHFATPGDTQSVVAQLRALVNARAQGPVPARVVDIASEPLASFNRQRGVQRLSELLREVVAARAR